MKRITQCFLPILLAVCLLSGCVAGDAAGSKSPAATAASDQTRTDGESASETQSDAVQSAVDEEKLYGEYLQNVGYENLIATYGDAESDIQLESCLTDLDADGVRELLLKLTDKNALGPAGYYSETVLLGVRDGSVEMIGSASYTGGTGGGNNLEFKYDTQTGRHVLVFDGFGRDGMFWNGSVQEVYDPTQTVETDAQFGMEGEGGTIYKIDHSLRSVFYADEGIYAEEAENLKRENELYEQEEYGVSAYYYDDEPITSAEFDKINERYVEPTDPAYQMQTVTPENPIP